MKCMGCSQETSEAKVFAGVFLCAGCWEMADHADKKIEEQIDAARVHARNWLAARILSGQLLLEPREEVRAVASDPDDEVDGASDTGSSGGSAPPGDS